MDMDRMLPPELLKIIACPSCKGELTQSDEDQSLACHHCRRSYPVVDGIPLLLPGQTDSASIKKCEPL